VLSAFARSVDTLNNMGLNLSTDMLLSFNIFKFSPKKSCLVAQSKRSVVYQLQSRSPCHGRGDGVNELTRRRIKNRRLRST
jgi:hypothetical protein